MAARVADPECPTPYIRGLLYLGDRVLLPTGRSLDREHFPTGFTSSLLGAYSWQRRIIPFSGKIPLDKTKNL